MIRKSKNTKRKKKSNEISNINIEKNKTYNIEIDFTEPKSNIIRVKKIDFLENNSLIQNQDEEDDNTDDSSEDNNSSDDGAEFRDKDKELKEKFKKGLSLEAQDVINMNDKEFNEIIEALKKMGISSEKTAQLKIVRNSSKENSNEIMR